MRNADTRSGFTMGQILLRKQDNKPVVYIKDLKEQYAGMIAVCDPNSLEVERGRSEYYTKW